MNTVFICTDLLTSENLGLCHKYIISLIRGGIEKFGTYTFTLTGGLKYCDYEFDAKRLQQCYNRLIDVGVVIREQREYEVTDGSIRCSHIDWIDEKRLKEIL